MGNEKTDESVLKYYLDTSFALINTKLDAMAQLHNERFSGLDARVKNLEEIKEDTSNHNIADLQNQIKERDKKSEEGKIRWSNYEITFFSGVVLTVMAGFITLFISILMIYITTKYGK